MKILNSIRKLFDKISVINQPLFFISYFLIIASDLFNDISYITKTLQIVDIVSVVLLLWIIFVNFIINDFNANKKNVSLYIFALLIGITSFVSNDRSLIKLAFLLLAFQKISFNNFISKDFKIRIFLVSIMFGLIYFGFVNNNLLEIRDGFERYSFGTAHPNSFALYLFFIFLDYLYLQYINKSSNVFNIILVTLLFVTFDLAFIGSKTCLILAILSSLIFIVRKTMNLDGKIIKKIIINSFLIAFLISIVSGIFYSKENSIYAFFDKLLSKRIFYAHQFLLNYSYSLFGKQLFSGKNMVIDNAYVNLFLRYGIILSMMFMYVFRQMFIKLYSMRKNILICIMLLMIFLGFSECGFYIPAKNPYMLLLALPFISEIGDEKNEKE